jgi:hypothetical protein
MRSRRLAVSLSGATASLSPGLLFVFLPKCPVCIALWLTAVTGVGFSAAGAAWVRWMLAVLSIAIAALIVIRVRRPQFTSGSAGLLYSRK